MDTPRKQVDLPESELTLVQKLAETTGVSVSAVGREWIDNFLEHGSNYKPEPTRKMQIIVDRERVAKAEAKARDEYGCSLRDIIRFNIAELAKL